MSGYPAKQISSELASGQNNNGIKDNSEKTNQQPQKKKGQNQPEWVIIALTLFAVVVNGLANNNVGPVASKISKVYQISTFYTVAPITVSFLVYALMNFPANYLIDVFGLRFSFIIGTLFYAVGQLMFIFIEFGYFFCIIGAILISIGQPFIINCPAKIATFWFMSHNRTMAVALITVFQLIGAAVGFLFPATFINENSEGNEAKKQFFILYIIQFGIGALCFIFVLIFMRNQPPSPPSLGASTQKISLKQSFILIFKKKNLWLYIIGYMIIAGSILSFSSSANLTLKPYGYTDIQIAILAIILLFCGVLGALITSFFVKKTLRYGLTIRVIPIVTAILVALLIICLNFLNYFGVVVTLGVFIGFIVTPIVPIAYDLMCELGFPIGQAQAVGILNGAAMVFTFAFTNIISLAVGLNSKKDSMIMLGSICGLLFIGVTFFFFVRIKLKRRESQKLGHLVTEDSTSHQTEKQSVKDIGRPKDIELETKTINGVTIEKVPASHANPLLLTSYKPKDYYSHLI